MKLVRKLFPVNVYDVAQTESYLNNMARRGFVFKKLATFAYFEKTETQNLAFRLEPLTRAEKKPSDEMIEYYASYGWEYVCTIAKLFHVYKSSDEEPIEIHTDPIMQGYTYDYLNKKLKLFSLISCFLFPIAMMMILYSMLFNDHPLLFAVKFGQITYQSPVFLMCIFTIYQLMRDRRKVKNLLTQLKLGVKMSHKESYKRNYITYVFLLAIIIMSSFTVFNSIYSITQNWYMDLSEYDDNLPTIHLSQIEKNDNFEIQDDYYENKNYNNYISHEWSELAPNMYEIHERGIVKGEKWKDNSGEYSPSLSTEFYDLRFKFLAEPLLEELMDDELDFFSFKPILYEELFVSSFDKAVFVKVDEMQMFYAIKDKQVIYVRYYGYEDLKSYIDEIENVVNNFVK